MQLGTNMSDLASARRRAAGLAAGVLWVTASACLQRAAYLPPPPPRPLPSAQRLEPVDVSGAPLTAERAVELALARNPDLAIASARVARAATRLQETEAAFWPRLAGDVAYLTGNAPSAFLFKRIDARALPPGVDFNDPGSFSNLEAGITARWNLWNGGRDLLTTWAADAGVGAAAEAERAARSTLVAAVVGAYLDARAARELITADDASVRAVESQVDETRTKVEGGGALRSDLLSLEVRLAEARQERVRSDVARRLALATLRELLALPPEADIRLADSGWYADDLPRDRAQALARAYRRRPETRAARHRVEQAGLQLAAARRAYLPRLDFQTRLYGDAAGARVDDFGEQNWTMAVALSVDLFDGFAREARIGRARAALDEVTERDRQTLLAVTREVETAYLRLEESEARLAVAERAVGAAEETLDLVSIRFRGGADTVTRFLEAEAASARARTNRIRARLDLDRAAVEVARAIGALVPDDAEPGQDAEVARAAGGELP